MANGLSDRGRVCRGDAMVMGVTLSSRVQRSFWRHPALLAMGANSFEFYDIALHGYMAPVMIPLLFPGFSTAEGYSFYLIIEALGALLQYVGARWFGTMGDRLGRVPAIRKAMMGMAISTVLLAALPVGGMIPGVMTLLYFTACRCAQSFFLGGQYHGGAIYCLEHTARARHGAISGWYGAATVAGMIMASLMATAVTLNGSASAFRWAYGLGACIMFFGGVYRLRFKETPVFDAAVEQGQPVEPLGWSLSSTAFRVLAASFFISFYFGLPTRVFNVLLPSQWGMNQSTVMGINTACLAVYMLLLPWAGGMADRFGMERMLRGSLLWIGLSTPLLLLVALQPTAWALVAVKLGMMVLAAFYIAPFHGWAYGLFRTRQRYGSVATAATLGKILSMVGLSLSVRLWEATGSLTLPSLLESLAALGLWYYLGLTRKVKASSKF